MAKSSYKQSAKFGIVETRNQVKAKASRTQAQWIKQVREKIFRERPACQICHGARWAECMGLPDQMHEDPSRAKTANLPLEERFNERICGRLCAACHRDVTEKRLWLTFADERRFAGHVMWNRDHRGESV